MTNFPLRFALLLGSAVILPFGVAAHAQQTPSPDQPETSADQTPPPANQAALPPDDAGDLEGMDSEEGEAIVVTGQRRGAAIGNIPPEKTYDARDVRATGATNINELLDAIAPEIGSARGRGGERPVLLLNGQRISSFRELRDIPTEAIERVDILPEEEALKYGYRADQRVVNIVLRPRFRSTTARLDGTTATDGGYVAGLGDLTRFMVEKNGRTTFNLHAEGNGMLTEDERNIIEQESDGTSNADEAGARSLIGTKRQLRGAATFNRQVLGNVSATLNTELEHDEGRSLIGLSDTLLEPLARNTTTDTAHAGVTLNGSRGNWRWNVTGNADLERDTTGTDRDDLMFPRDHARETRESGDLNAVANGNLFTLPAGKASTTIKVGGSTIHQKSERIRAGDSSANSLGRTEGDASINVDIPISRRGYDFHALGNLTLNGNAEVDHLSDFGTLTIIGAGANFSPVDRLNLITSWTREEGAPSVQQLGDPVLETPGTRIFDFTTGQTVLVTAITGGNPGLQADRRSVFKLGGNWQPFENTDFRLRADYVHQRIERPIQNIFGPTAAIEAAFPDRFVRCPPQSSPTVCSPGQLVSADLRPVNFDHSQRDTLRLGFSFSKPLKSKAPSAATINRLRSQFRGRASPPAAEGASGTGSPSAAPQSAAPSQPQAQQGAQQSAPPTASARSGGRGRGGFGRFGRNRDRGRIQFSLTDTVTLVDRVTIRPGLPELDYLHGEAAGQTGGTPRHNVEARAGWYNNGYGVRLGAKWRSGTKVNSSMGDSLHFSPLATFDLRVFANLGDKLDLVAKHPFLRGASVRFEVNNLFDARPKVHDAMGNVPLSYQPDLLDPLGRTIMISIRKQFLPSPAFYRRQREQEQQQAQPAR